MNNGGEAIHDAEYRLLAHKYSTILPKMIEERAITLTNLNADGRWTWRGGGVKLSRVNHT